VHHQNVDESGEVDREDIVKGYEYTKGKYVEIDPEELKALQIPTATTMQIKLLCQRRRLVASPLRSALFRRSQG